MLQRSFRLLFVLHLTLCGLMLWVPAYATPEQDKATARIAATEGITLYRQGRFQDALTKLEAAQSLFQAPVHVLYIARCEKELGKWVEAAEHYREVIHQPLDPGAPDAFAKAQAEARAELASLEPRIPKLNIQLSPSDARVTTLRIDWQEVSTAVVGIARPTNPGQHIIRVEADGFEPLEKQVDAPEGQTMTVQLELKPSQSKLGQIPAEPVKAPSAKSKKNATISDSGNSTKPPANSLIAGLRLGGAFPGGKLPGRVLLPNASSDAKLSLDQVGRGGADIELQLGALFPSNLGIVKTLGLHLFLQLNPLKVRDGNPLEGAGFDYPASLSTPTLSTAGIGLVAAGDRNKFSGFVELGFIFTRNLSYSLKLAEQCSGEADPEVKVTASGLGLRAATGVNIPVNNWLKILPYVSFSASSVNAVQYKANTCAVMLLNQQNYGVDLSSGSATLKLDNSPNYSLVSLGIGGEFSYLLD